MTSILSICVLSGPGCCGVDLGLGDGLAAMGGGDDQLIDFNDAACVAHNGCGDWFGDEDDQADDAVRGVIGDQDGAVGSGD